MKFKFKQKVKPKFNVMKKIINGMILMAGVVAASQSAKAQFTANDLYLGFENASATSDYIIDLGQASTIVGGTSIVNLSDDFSLSNFNTVLGASSANVMGVVGGKVLFPSTYDVYATDLRSGGPGNPAVAGSDLTISLNLNNSAIAQSVASIAVINAPVAGTGVLDTSKSWSANIEPTFTSGTFYGNTGVNPGSAISGSGVLYEDL
ncbi:MAG TPA: hypothetical protein VHG71_08650, partial [Verrucomicrobiae bacterium]|nr:hypothetical protein [Verrucomicrobiae bacterium]